MKRSILTFVLITLTLSASLIVPEAATAEPNISVMGYFGTNKAQHGRVLRISMVIDIPSGYHINSSRPVESYLIATDLKVEAPNGVRVGAISYPTPLLKSFKFSKKKLSVYEGQVRVNST